MRQKLILVIAIIVFAATAVTASTQATASTVPQPQAQPAPAETTAPAPPVDQDQPPVTTVPETPVEVVTEPPAPELPVEAPPVNQNDPIVPGSNQQGSTQDRGSDPATQRGGKNRQGKRDKTGGKDAEEDEDEEEGDEEEGDEEELDPNDIFGPAPIAVPNMVLDSFEIPPFLLPIYQACGTQYAIPWQLLAAINKIETAFGTNLSVSYAGAMGWMQFMPGTWASYGVDANGDGRKDPYNPVDAICAAARYLRAAGGTERLREAIFAYNHANWYVEDVLELTRQYSLLPEHLISSLSGLTEGAHFPVASNARYADQVTVAEAVRKARTRGGVGGNVANVLGSTPDRRSVTIFARPGAPVIAVNDGVIRAVGESEELGKHVVLEDAYGNRFTYAGLGSLMDTHPVPRRQRLTDADFEMVTPNDDKMPSTPASAAKQPAEPQVDPESIDAAPESSDTGAPVGSREAKRATRLAEQIARKSAGEHHGHDHASDGRSNSAAANEKVAVPVNTEDARPRLFARPHRPNNVEQAALAGQLDHPIAGGEEFEAFEANPHSLLNPNGNRYELRPLRKGSRVIGGTLLGRTVGAGTSDSGTIKFSIRPAGDDAPAIDPKPILDGWRLLAATDIYRAKRNNPFFTGTGVGQVLMLPKSALIRRVLNDPRLEIYSCGREDIANGSIDRRVLALLSYLAERGFRLTVTSLLCGRSGLYTTSGNISNHMHGGAVDIAAINGQQILGNQGPGSLTEAVLKAILRLQGTMVPSELISLHEMGGPSFAMGDHADHIHVGYRAMGESNSAVSQAPQQILEPGQWTRLMQQLGRIENPVVPNSPSDVATPAEAGE